ncbi:MAG TPA: flagellar basal body-associated FliL family protein [Alphaproteobacteria bacterium]|nr:flagellar basal body-associated FliL family protein [Alphaproteobacteria bacterium]HNS44079.1 flagellar basal body-associated FliL family protein [Alphaproteobacteria bacterium]
MSEETESPEAGEGGDVAPIDGGGNNKTKKLLMIIVPVLLLVGGGAGLYFSGMLDSLLGKEQAAAEGGEHAEGGEGGHGEAKEGEGGRGDAKEGEGGHGGGATATFMKVPDLIVNLSSSGQPRYLRLSIQLELNSEEDMKKVEAVLPRVIDQFQTYLRELRVDDLKGSKGIYRLQMELLARVNAAASPVEVKDVLFQEILIQ